MKNMGDSVNENVEPSCFHGNETKENSSPLEPNNTRSLHSLVISFVALLGWFLGLLLHRPAEDIKNSTNMSSSQGRKRPKDPKTARVFVIDDSSSCDKLLQCHRSKYAFKMNYIGIDCEWVNKKGQVNAPVALLQIATPLCDCFLVRLCKMDGQIPKIVKEILEDKTVLKFGVGIQNDAKRLLEMFAIHVRGCVDLRHVAQRTQLENGNQSSCQKMSLDALARRILGVKLNKSWRIQCSNWEEEKLSTQQIEYAMNDALVASHIFLVLVKEKAKQSLDSDDCSPCNEMFKVRDVCKGDEGTNQSSAITSECHPDSNETCLTLKQSGENVELYLTGREAAAGFNEHHDSPTSEFAQNRNLSQEGNCEAEELSTQQIEYAMNDALVASHIFLSLAKENSMQSTDLDDLSYGEKNFRNVCNEDEETRNQSFSITREYHPENNENGLILKQSGENVELCLTSQEAAACYCEHHDSPTSEFAENRNLNQEGKYQGKINDENTKITCQRSAVKEERDLFPDSQICHFQSLASGADYFETTVDLSKFESDEMAGYLSRDKVIGLISDPYFTQRAGSLCQGVIDMSFKARKRKGLIDKDSNSFSQEKSRKPYKKGTTRKSPLYMNCMLTAPDGSRLCTLDHKKADWYIDRGLGHLTNLDPYTVQLNFEPAGRPGTEDYYYLNFKDNICVVCGSDESYMRKNVVPHDYRRYFPLAMKDHHSHDILLTCPRCHSLANFFDDQLRKELAIKYNAPLGSAAVSRLVEDPELRKVKSAAKALSHAGNRIPEARRQELSLVVQKHFSVSALTPEMISQAATMETHKENANFVSHGFEVVKRVCAEGKLLEFEKMWREHFVDTMQPKFLPPLWSVDHRHGTLKGKLRGCPDHL